MGTGLAVRVVDASFQLERAAEARALLKLGLDSPAELEAALLASGWAVHRSRTGAIDDLDWAGPVFSDAFNQLLPRLGPFVAAGSYIVLEGEDGRQCRWDFDGRDCTFVDLGLWDAAAG